MKIIIKSLIVIVVFVLSSCEDILVEDISKDKVTINYPKSNQEITSNVVNFQWQELEGAGGYRIQLYSSDDNMILDSLITSTNFLHSLNAGKYRWKLRGENSGYHTEYSTINDFTMIETQDLTNQSVLLISPETNYYTKVTTPLFTWTKLNAADSYTFQLINNTANTIVYEEADIQDSSLSLGSSVITDDGKYTWKVKAINSDNDTESEYSSRIIYIDRTAPLQPQNTLPENNVIRQNSGPVNFSWSTSTDVGAVSSSVKYTIQIAGDQNFSGIINTGNPVGTTYSYTFSTSGTYYWRIKAIDLAGNESIYSTHFKITIQ